MADAISERFGRRALAMRADATSEADAHSVAERAATELGRIDVLINNARINIRGANEELTYEEFREVERTNLDLEC